jgi:hypothetical protein
MHHSHRTSPLTSIHSYATPTPQDTQAYTVTPNTSIHNFAKPTTQDTQAYTVTPNTSIHSYATPTSQVTPFCFHTCTDWHRRNVRFLWQRCVHQLRGGRPGWPFVSEAIGQERRWTGRRGSWKHPEPAPFAHPSHSSPGVQQVCVCLCVCVSCVRTCRACLRVRV